MIALPLVFTMAWRNIWRNSRRSILTLAAIAFSTLLLVFMLSVQQGLYSSIIKAHLQLQSGHIHVQARWFRERGDMRRVLLHPEPLAGLVEEMPLVRAYTFRTSAFAIAASRERTAGARVVGIEPRETGVSALPAMVRSGRFFGAGDRDLALVGALLARNLQVDLGDELSILGQGYDGSIAATVVTVGGIFGSGVDEVDRSTLFIPLPAFQEAYSMGPAVHELVIMAGSLDDVPVVKRELVKGIGGLPGREEIAVLDWQELAPGLLALIRLDMVFWLVFYFILVVTVAFSILNTFQMAIFERSREFGVMRSVGSTPWQLVRLLLLESTIMALIGALAGVLLGGLLTRYLQTHGIVFPGLADWTRRFGLPNRVFPILTVLSIASGSGLILLISMVAAAYPIWQVVRLRPLRAMKAA